MTFVKQPVLVLLVVSLILIYYAMRSAMEKLPKIRTIPALEAFEEAVGRAVEMDRPVHYTTGGSGSLFNKTAGAILASLSIMSHVAKLCARYGARLITTHRQAEVIPIAEEIVRTAYIAEGKTEDLTTDIVRFLGGSQFAYASGVLGILQREKPAANFAIGRYGGDALIVVEAGAIAGAMQVAGNATYGQMPFMIAVADYALICEEMFAAGAYLSEEPRLLGSIAGQDYVKIFAIALIIIGVIATLAGIDLNAILS